MGSSRCTDFSQSQKEKKKKKNCSTCTVSPEVVLLVAVFGSSLKMGRDELWRMKEKRVQLKRPLHRLHSERVHTPHTTGVEAWTSGERVVAPQGGGGVTHKQVPLIQRSAVATREALIVFTCRDPGG